MNTRKVKQINSKIYYGWFIVLVCGLSMFFSAPGQSFFLSVFIGEYIREFGFDDKQLAILYSLATLLSAFLLFIMGKLIDRFGQKKMMMVVGCLLALTTVFNSFATTIPMIFIGLFLSRYFGQGSMSLLPATLIPQWFQKKRGIATSLYRYGYTIAAILIPALNMMLIKQMGWQGTWRVWSILLIVIFVPIVALTVVNTPESVGLRPDNDVINNGNEDKQSLNESNKNSNEESSWQLNEAIRTKSFWTLGIISSLTPLISTGIMFHFVLMMQDRGIASENAAYILGVLSMPGLVFPLIGGKILDHFKPNRLLALMLGLQCMGLIGIGLSKHTTMLIAAVFIYGIGASTQSVAIGVMWPNYFGRKHLGSIQSVSTFFVVFGSSVGAIILSIGHDIMGTYTFPVLCMAFLMMMGATMAYFIKKPIKQSGYSLKMVDESMLE